MAVSYDIKDVFATKFGTDATGGEEEIVTLSLRDAGEEDGQTSDEAEVYAMGCAMYRPADPDDDGKCQALTAQIGPRRIAICTRDSRAAKAFGALNKGDAVFGSPTGAGQFRANGDGSIGFRRTGKAGAPDTWVHIEADGSIILGNEAGQFELSKENGLLIALDGGVFLQLSAKTGFVVSAPTVSLAAGSVALGVGASTPLAVAPITGTVGAGFVSAKPVLNVFVP